jgi:hypothetical protein
MNLVLKMMKRENEGLGGTDRGREMGWAIQRLGDEKQCS